MLLFTGRLAFPDLDVGRYTQTLRNQAATQLRQAAREWLRAVVPRIPVWAGTARGSLVPLGRFLQVAVPIAPRVTRPGLGPGVGAHMAPQGIGGYFQMMGEGDRFFFRFNTDVAHFIRNEFYHAPDPPFHLIEPTPWHALDAGKAAFDRYMANTAPGRMPRYSDFIEYTSRVIGPR